MNSLDAVEKVLQEVGKPLHSSEITRKIVDQGLWKTTGKTPEATINAAIAVDIADLGEHSRFLRTAPSTFALRTWGLTEYSGKKVSKKQPQFVKSHRLTDQSKAGEVTTKQVNASVKPLAFADAAEKVLQQFGTKEPMHYKVITQKALNAGLITTHGQTPDQTMYAQILTEIDKDTQRGQVPRFTKYGKGFVGLTQWVDRGLGQRIEEHNRAVRRRLRQQLYDLTPAQFEDLIGALLARMGFESVQVTSPNNDGGIDVRGTLVVGSVIRTRMAIQVKRWKNNVQAPTVQQVRGSLGAHEQGLIITTSDFSEGAKKEAARPDAIPVALMTGEELTSLLVQFNLGVTRTAYELIELSDSENGEATIE